ncbi:hypothetical protein D3C76_925230 [compost metagenome]
MELIAYFLSWKLFAESWAMQHRSGSGAIRRSWESPIPERPSTAFATRSLMTCVMLGCKTRSSSGWPGTKMEQDVSPLGLVKTGGVPWYQSMERAAPIVATISGKPHIMPNRAPQIGLGRLGTVQKVMS